MDIDPNDDGGGLFVQVGTGKCMFALPEFEVRPLPQPGSSRTRCLPNCTQMGPHAELTDRTVTENIVTGLHFLGCKSCGTYDREQPTDASGARLPRGVVKPKPSPDGTNPL